MNDSTAITKQNSGVSKQSQYNREEVALIKQTVAPGASDLELRMFLHTCQRSGLDPLRKQIYFAKIKGRVVIMAGIDGLQARAEDFPDYEGTIAHAVCEKDEFVFDAMKGEPVKHTFTGDRGKPVGAWARIQRAGKTPFSVYVKISDYNKNENNWVGMPTVMIEKVARATALRRAFPDAFSGIYEPGEMRQDIPVGDGGKQKLLDELKELGKGVPDDVKKDIKERSLGSDRVAELENGSAWTKEDYEKMLAELKVWIAASEANDETPETEDGPPPCSACGKELGDSKATDADGAAICATCQTAAQESEGQQSLV